MAEKISSGRRKNLKQERARLVAMLGDGLGNRIASMDRIAADESIPMQERNRIIRDMGGNDIMMAAKVAISTLNPLKRMRGSRAKKKVARAQRARSTTAKSPRGRAPRQKKR